MEAGSRLHDEEADEHRRQGVIDAEGPGGDELPGIAAGDRGGDPGEVGDGIYDQSPSPVPAAGAEAGHVHGETLVGDAVGVEGQDTLWEPPEVDGEGGAHEEVAEVDHEGRHDDSQGPGAGGEHGDPDELGAAGEHQQGHDPHVEGVQARFLGQDPQGRADGNVPQADRPGGG